MTINFAQLAFRYLLETAIDDNTKAKVFLPAAPGDDSIWGELASVLSETLECVTLPDGEPFLEALTTAIRDSGVSRCAIIPPWQRKKWRTHPQKPRPSSHSNRRRYHR